MNDKISGIVLQTSDYKDNDILAQVLTKQYGIISFVAKGSKKLNSKNHILPMCVYEFIYDHKDGKTIFSIHNQKLLRNFFQDKDIEMISFKDVLIELTLKNRDIDTYDELLFVFNKLNKENRYLLGCLYLSFLIKEFGIAPNVDGCVICGNKKVVSISSQHGGFLCINHIQGHEIMSLERLKKFRMIVKARMENYDVLKDIIFDNIDFENLLEFYMINADIKIRSYDLYKTLNI